MKTNMKIKVLIGTLFIGVTIMSNVIFTSGETFPNFLYLGDIEALAADESGSGVIGTKYQIQAGCNGESFFHWKHHCCRGSDLTCVEKCPNGMIYNGCDTHGRLPL